MKIKSIKMLLIAAIVATLGALTACSNHTEVNNLVGTLNQYADSFSNVTTLEEFNEMMLQFNDATTKYVDSDAKIDQSDREAILKAIDNFSASVNKAMSKTLGVPEMTAEQRQKEMESLTADLANTKTLGELIKVCMAE